MNCDHEGCTNPPDEYTYPDGLPAHLCEEHSKGIFCPGCGAFTGGTEEIFIYGEFACSNCAGELESDGDEPGYPYDY